MTERDELLQAKEREELAEAQQQLRSCVHAYVCFIQMCMHECTCVCVYYTGRNYQDRAAVSAGQGQGASSGTAATETAG